MNTFQVGTGNRSLFETTFVMFFLSLDFGAGLLNGSYDTAFVGVTIAAVAVLPFYLPSADRISFSNWMVGRGAIVVFGMVLGIVFNQLLGVLLPEAFRFVPLGLAMVAAAASCCIMFANFFRMDFAD